MRLTIELPEDLAGAVRELALQREQSMSDAVVELVRLGLSRIERPIVGPRDLPARSIGRPVAAEDVRSLDDEGC